MRTCPSCGTGVGDEDSVCPSCGVGLGDAYEGDVDDVVSKDSRVWNGLFWTSRVNPNSNDEFIVQTANLFRGQTLTISRARWVTSFLVSMIFLLGIFAFALFGLIVTGEPMLLLLMLLVLPGLIYSAAQYRWSMRAR